MIYFQRFNKGINEGVAKRLAGYRILRPDWKIFSNFGRVRQKIPDHSQVKCA